MGEVSIATAPALFAQRMSVNIWSPMTATSVGVTENSAHAARTAFVDGFPLLLVQKTPSFLLKRSTRSFLLFEAIAVFIPALLSDETHSTTLSVGSASPYVTRVLSISSTTAFMPFESRNPGVISNAEAKYQSGEKPFPISRSFLQNTPLLIVSYLALIINTLNHQKYSICFLQNIL